MAALKCGIDSRDDRKLFNGAMVWGNPYGPDSEKAIVIHDSMTLNEFNKRISRWFGLINDTLRDPLMPNRILDVFESYCLQKYIDFCLESLKKRILREIKKQ